MLVDRRRQAPALPVVVAVVSSMAFTAISAAFEGPRPFLVPMSDGLRIDVDLRWPDDDPPKGGWPAIVLAHSRRGSKDNLADEAAYFADRGYVTLAYSCRGDGQSTEGGNANDTSAATRGRDVKELRDWLVTQMPLDVTPDEVRANPTRIGMTGASQGALNTWYGALAGADFAAIVPQCISLHMWNDGFVRNGSILFRLQRMKASHPALAMYASGLLLMGTRGDAVADRIPTVTTPVLTEVAMLDSWAPANNAIADFMAATGASARMIYIGTGGHNTADTDEAYRDRYLRDAWFDHYLKGAANGIDKQPRIHVSLLDSLEKVAFDSFPHPDEQRVTLYLSEGDALRRAAPDGVDGVDRYVNDTAGYSPQDALADEFEQDRLLGYLRMDAVHFQTGPLLEDVVLLGVPSVSLFVDGTASKYQVNVHLTDDAPNGDRRLLAWGTYLVNKATYPDGAELAWDLSYTGRRIVKGHRLGLSISNIDLEVLVPSEPALLRHLPYFEPGEVSVHFSATKPSQISVPIIQGEFPPGDVPSR